MHKFFSRLSDLMGQRQAFRFWCGLNRKVRRLAVGTHWQQHYAQFGMNAPTEWYDHYVDMYRNWPVHGDFQFLERGVLNSLAIRHAARVLDLCSGSGFNTRNFYSHRAEAVMGADFDQSAIDFAKAQNSAPNVTYTLCDIRNGVPPGPWDNICWDAAIEHFTADEIWGIMDSIKANLKPDGILSGYTIVEKDGARNFHEIAFNDCDDLRRFFTKHFKNVRVTETFTSGLHNLYFYAADVPVPFDTDWVAQR